MNFEKSYKEQLNLSKRIPLHYQRRYFANISNGSFNASFVTGVYKNKIKMLQKNNKMLALALQIDKAKKEELLEESKANANLIMFSRLNLACMSENLKKVVSALDDTLALFELHSTTGLSKFSTKSTICRGEFKEQIKNVLMDVIPEENKQSPSNELKERLNNKDIQKSTIKTQGCFTNTSNQEEKKNSKNEKPNSKFSVSSELNNSSFEMKHDSSKIKKKRTATKKQKIIKNPNERKQCSAVSKKKKKNGKDNFVIEKHDIQLKQNNMDEKLYGKEEKVLQNMEFHDSLDYNLTQTRDEMTLVSNLMKDSMNNLKSNKIFSNINPNENKENIQSRNPSITIENLEILPESQIILTSAKKASTSGSALKNLSSKINIENLTLNRKKSLASLDDLTKNSVISQVDSLKHKSKRKLLQNKIGKKVFELDKITNKDILTENCTNKNISNNQFQNLFTNSFQPQEIVKNLAKNTVLTTVEIHKTPDRENSMKNIPRNLDEYHQPIVLVQDIFKVNKSFCKSISNSSQFDSNIPLEMQLIQHCSSLKIIPEESEASNNSSEENTKASKYFGLKKKQKLKKIMEEPSSSVEEEIEDYYLNIDKRPLRKRSTVNYKESSLNIKMRR